ncbi:MAG: HAD family hydrolase [Clostridia bacterium]|nr:HAD family hydrolase [Clostridia bacterium]
MKYPCLVLDHDDTVVQSTAQIHYPAFIHCLAVFRPQAIPLDERGFIEVCAHPGLMEYYQQVHNFTQEEMALELDVWRTFVKEKIPDAHEGFRELLTQYKQAGGMVCVVSHSDKVLIERDYQHHFGFTPDLIYDLAFAPHKPDPAPLQDLMHRYRFQPNQLLVVDDLPVGKAMADAAGVDFVYAGWCNTAPSVHEHMVSISPCTLYHPSELANLLELI